MTWMLSFFSVFGILLVYTIADQFGVEMELVDIDFLSLDLIFTLYLDAEAYQCIPEMHLSQNDDNSTFVSCDFSSRSNLCVSNTRSLPSNGYIALQLDILNLNRAKSFHINMFEITKKSSQSSYESYQFCTNSVTNHCTDFLVITERNAHVLFTTINNGSSMYQYVEQSAECDPDQNIDSDYIYTTEDIQILHSHAQGTVMDQYGIFIMLGIVIICCIFPLIGGLLVCCIMYNKEELIKRKEREMQQNHLKHSRIVTPTDTGHSRDLDLVMDIERMRMQHLDAYDMDHDEDEDDEGDQDTAFQFGNIIDTKGSYNYSETEEEVYLKVIESQKPEMPNQLELEKTLSDILKISDSSNERAKDVLKLTNDFDIDEQ